MSRARTADRVVTRERAVEVVRAYKSEGVKVVLANGVFDLLHVGHARYLAGARALGDRLVVAVNGDRSAHALKGPGRPVATLTGLSRRPATRVCHFAPRPSWLIADSAAISARDLPFRLLRESR